MSAEEKNDLILLADDSLTTLSMVSARLQRMGYDVVTATRGDDALGLTRERRPSLVVLDLEMPGLGGIQLVQQLRADPSFADMPIILLTSHAEEEYVQAGRDAGANAYVVKPFSPQDLASKVDELLGRR